MPALESPRTAVEDRSGASPERATAAATVPFTAGFLLVPGFPMMAFAAAIEPLRAANRLCGEPRFAWRLYSHDGAAVRASNGIEFAADGALDEARGLQLLLVCAGTRDRLPGETNLAKALRRLAHRGCAVGGISLGAYVLARAGLLDGCRCAVHWENLAAFAEEFPRVRTTADLFAVDGRRYTCSGGTAALDMMLQLIAARHGVALAKAVSEQFIHPQIRDAGEPQRMAIRARLGVANAKLVAAVGVMESALDEPRDVAAIAAAVDLSRRQLERLFARYLDTTPRAHYLALRLERARMLLRQSTRPILDIAVASGFGSASHFSRCYRELYGRRPSDERAPAAGPPRR
jgi:transcriptional regulator GlxA family with amidase domain